MTYHGSSSVSIFSTASTVKASNKSLYPTPKVTYLNLKPAMQKSNVDVEATDRRTNFAEQLDRFLKANPDIQYEALVTLLAFVGGSNNTPRSRDVLDTDLHRHGLSMDAVLRDLIVSFASDYPQAARDLLFSRLTALNTAAQEPEPGPTGAESQKETEERSSLGSVGGSNTRVTSVSGITEPTLFAPGALHWIDTSVAPPSSPSSLGTGTSALIDGGIAGAGGDNNNPIARVGNASGNATVATAVSSATTGYTVACSNSESVVSGGLGPDLRGTEAEPARNPDVNAAVVSQGCNCIVS